MPAFDFQAQQERARRASALLTVVFVLMAATISLIIGALAALFLQPEPPRPSPEPLGPLELLQTLDPAWVIGLALVVMAVIVGVALVRLVMFGRDGAAVAKAFGAEEVGQDTRNPYKRRYLNVVEEMAIAANIPQPRAFVIKREQGINAFAAGHDPERAAVAVTHGALAKLTRAELAGVVAHEMAHIKNHDTRLNVRLMAMVFGLVALYVVGRMLLRASIFRRRGNRNGAPLIVIGLALLVLGLLGGLFGRILQSAVSRRREYLADATAVEFTRNPSGIAGALKKIGATQAHGTVANAHAEEARHMFFAQATSALGGLFATHPPLADRIRALEPTFDPERDAVWRMDERALLETSRRELGPWAAAASEPSASA